MEKVLIEAQKRDKIDKASRSALRKEGKVPAIFYSKHHDPLPVQVSERAIHPLVFTSKTHLITLNVEGHEELQNTFRPEGRRDNVGSSSLRAV